MKYMTSCRTFKGAIRERIARSMRVNLVSGSRREAPIDALNQGIPTFKEDLPGKDWRNLLGGARSAALRPVPEEAATRQVSPRDRADDDPTLFSRRPPHFSLIHTNERPPRLRRA